MSRSGYSDDLDSAELNLYRGRVTRAIRGKRGQAFIRELLEALDAMPEKRLVAGELQDHDGEVCAIGSVGARRGVDMSNLDPENPDQVGKVFDIARCLAAEIVFQNDEAWGGQTPEKRFERMRKWAASHLIAPVA